MNIRRLFVFLTESKNVNRMSNKLLYCTLLLFFSLNSWCQEAKLVIDYTPGTDDTFQKRLQHYQNSIVFIGNTEQGQAIMQYDKHTDEMYPLLQNDDVLDEIIFFSTNREEIIFFTGLQGYNKHLYRSQTRDLSDLNKVYSTQGDRIGRVRISGDRTIIMDVVKNDGVETINIILIDEQGEITEVLSGLTDSVFDYDVRFIGEVLLIAPNETAINGENLIAYNMSSKTTIPIDNVLQNYDNCGLHKRFVIYSESILIHDCQENWRLYDIEEQRYLDYDEGDITSIRHIENDYIYYISGTNLNRLNKTTLQKEYILDYIASSNFNGDKLIGIALQNFNVKMFQYNFQNEVLDYYDAPFSSLGEFNIISNYAEVNEGKHFSLYSFDHENALLCKIKNDNIEVISEYPRFGNNVAPVDYEEDIYFIPNDPEHGAELFVVDYLPSSTVDQQDVHYRLSPNPASELIEIQSEEDSYSISVYNLSGNLIHQCDDCKTINVSKFHSGIYILEMTTKQGYNSKQKFVVR